MTTSPIAISSGHGKYIRGASGKSCGSWGLDEVDEARRVVAEVANQLKARGITVRGPFNDDISQSQNENLNRIVNWHNGQDRVLDVSVHFNANACTSNGMGTECLYVSQESLADEVAAAIAAAGHLKDRGPKHRTDLFFLNNTHEPAILIEVCFVDSSADADLYRANFNAVCLAIASAISGVSVDQPPTEPPPTGEDRPVIGEGDTGPYVVSIQKSLGLSADGDFGPITRAGVIAFQRAWGLKADGFVGGLTWAELDQLDHLVYSGDEDIPDELSAQIDQIVARSPILTYSWDDRGRASQGYYEGMAKTFAGALIGLDDNDPNVLAMAAADKHKPDTDALSWYANEFADLGMSNNVTGAETLRHLFVLMMGLGLRESGGNHWCGRDMNAENVQSDTCEAGLFQSSWNLASASPSIEDLFDIYKNDPNGFRPSFTKGLSPQVEDLDNYGSGDGCYYQWLAKFCPAFATLMTAVGLRTRRQHWGPINRKEAELVPMADDLLTEVEKLVYGGVDV